MIHIENLYVKKGRLYFLCEVRTNTREVAVNLANLFATSTGSEISLPSDLNIVFNWGLVFFLDKTSFKIFQFACVFDLASSNFFS